MVRFSVVPTLSTRVEVATSKERAGSYPANKRIEERIPRNREGYTSLVNRSRRRVSAMGKKPQAVPAAGADAPVRKTIPGTKSAKRESPNINHPLFCLKNKSKIPTPFRAARRSFLFL
jgi:hypothetical protein